MSNYTKDDIRRLLEYQTYSPDSKHSIRLTSHEIGFNVIVDTEGSSIRNRRRALELFEIALEEYFNKGETFKVVFDGFKTIEQAKVFAQWYSGSGEQHSECWLEDHSDGPCKVNSNEVIVPLKLHYKLHYKSDENL